MFAPPRSRHGDDERQPVHYRVHSEIGPNVVCRMSELTRWSGYAGGPEIGRFEATRVRIRDHDAELDVQGSARV